LKNRFNKLPSIILAFFIIIAFTFTTLDSTSFARGSGSKSKGTTTSKATPKSGAKSGSFSNSSKSTTQPKSGAKSGSFSNSTKTPSSSSSGSKITNNNTSNSFPTIIFWPHRTYYYDSYGISHYRYASPSLFGILGDLIILIIVITLIMWFVKRRK